MANRYISDYIDVSKIKTHVFNLIASGTGTGKSTFIVKDLLNRFQNIKPIEIIFVTSRAMIVDQQIKNDNISKLYQNNHKLINYWNGEDNYNDINNINIQIMPYSTFLRLIKNNDYADKETLERVKMIIFDECHTIFSDEFMKDIGMVKMWISFTLKYTDKIILGLTATPYILHYEYENKMWGVEINQLNDDILINYKSHNLICTNFDAIPYLITSNTLKGKTLIMCYSFEDCTKLEEQIPNSTILVSKSNKRYFSKAMDELREYIVENANLPETYSIYEYDSKGKIVGKTEYPLKVLITTSTLREGVNIESVSNVKNVICCFTDELHIVQFAGRCRHDLDTLVVAESYIRGDNQYANEYIKMRRKQYSDFLNLVSDGSEWFDSISHIVDIPIFKIYKIKFSKNTLDFIRYMNSKWLIPVGIDETNIKKYYIHKDDDKNEILNVALKLKILDSFEKRKDRRKFNTVMNFMKNHLGYKIEDGYAWIGKESTKYKLIVEYDKNKGDFRYIDCNAENREDGDN